MTTARVALAWAPYAIMSVLLLLSGILRQIESEWKAGYLKRGEPIPAWLAEEWPGAAAFAKVERLRQTAAAAK